MRLGNAGHPATSDGTYAARIPHRAGYGTSDGQDALRAVNVGLRQRSSQQGRDLEAAINGRSEARRLALAVCRFLAPSHSEAGRNYYPPAVRIRTSQFGAVPRNPLIRLGLAPIKFEAGHEISKLMDLSSIIAPPNCDLS
jgi:hypothetical protein